MERYGEILLIAMPVFLILVILEKWYGHRNTKDTLPLMDMISSLSSGITNVTKDVLGLSVSIISYKWMFDHWAIIHFPNKFLTYFIAFIALDFSGYWVHRISHQYNFFWNNHIIHHSSEEYNLACALRQSISAFVRLFTFFLLPAALMGVPPEVIAVITPIHLFAQFWYHTRHIGKMGVLEKIIVTPSHHRVHHAINKEYLDKNFSNIFIFWDKWFGSFQEELKDVIPVYGITRPVRTWNPIKINFMHLWLLLKDAFHTKNWHDKLSIWFKPTGWRPADVEQKYPITKIDSILHYEKYEPSNSKLLKTWSLFQLIVSFLMISYFFANIASINAANPYHIYIYGFFVFFQVYCFTDLMDVNGTAPWLELSKNILIAGWVFMNADWFLIAIKLPWVFTLIPYYLFGSSIMSFWIIKFLNNNLNPIKA